MPREPVHTSVTGVDVLAFATELVLVACAAYAGGEWAQRAGFATILGIVVGAIAVALVWGLWMAPRARRRLDNRGRAVLAFVLGAAVAAALVPFSMLWVALAIGSGVVLAIAALTG